MSRRWSLLFAVVLCAAPLSAQDLRTVVQNLFQFGTGCGNVPLCLYPDLGTAHGTHFNTALTTGQTSLIGFLTDAIGVSVSDVPISATSSGATFTFVGGVPVKTSVSAGPVFGERSQTLGRNKLLIGTNVTGISFQSLRGVPLHSIVFDFTHLDTPPTGLGNPGFENDIFEVRPNIDVSVTVASLFVTYGILDRVDLSVAVPLARTAVSGFSIGSIRPFGPGSPHFFGDSAGDSLPTKRFQDTSVVSGTATGIGDIAARLKINLSQSDRGGFAVLVDTRLPTGDEANFLGSGHVSVRGIGIWSARFGDFSPHGNFGYLYRSGGKQNSALLATVGFDHLLSPWATMAVDVITQYELGASKLQLPGTVTIQIPAVRTVQTANIPDQRDHIVNGSVGFKFTTKGGMTFVTNSLFPLRKAGLQANIVWTVGAEHNF